jgi:hypothetical protein
LRGVKARWSRFSRSVLWLAVLHVVDVPAPRCGIFDLVYELEKASRRLDVAGLRRHDENSIDPIHRDNAYDAAKRTFGLSLKHPLELTGSLCGVAIAYREESVGLTSQDVDVKGPDEPNQGPADR